VRRYGERAAEVRRRILSAAALLAALLTIALAAGLAAIPAAQASPARAAAAGSPAGVSVTINSMNPSYAAPGATVNLSGTVTNHTGQAKAGLLVRLYTSQDRFLTRDGMDAYLGHGVASGLTPAGPGYTISASVPPGASVAWSTSFEVSTAGISVFGVYPVTAQLQDLSTGDVLSTEQTLLPFWPGAKAASLLSPLKISWLWPLIDQPHNQVCPALTSNGLAASLRAGGRLAALLTAGASHADADLTWVIDPALLSDVNTMASPYLVGTKPNCTNPTEEPALPAARSWLATLRQVSPAQPTVITPYADVDMSALIHQGRTADLATAFSTGDAVAGSVLHGKFGHEIAWPPGGTADLSLLTNLAAAEHVSTVVLNSGEMKPVNADTVFQPDDAVTSLRVAGLPMNVLLSDKTLTSVLQAGDTGTGTMPQGTEFAVRQRFLAETAMIAAEEPNSARTIVVAPPANWSPSQTLAGDLLGETTTTPWLAPTTLDRLSSSADTQRTVVRVPPPASKASPGELSRGYLRNVGTIDTKLGVYQSMLYKPKASYSQSLNTALVATESAAWRGRAATQGGARAHTLSEYLGGALSKVKIITSAQVPMGGSSGLVPVSIQNGLQRQAIQVRVVASAVNSPSRTSQLTIGHFQSLVIVYPQQVTEPVRLPVSSAPQGSTEIQLSLTSANGTPLPVTAKLIVVSTRYGRAILFLIGAAIGVLVLTSGYRGIRRWLHDDAHLVNEEADPPGSVVTGTDALHPTEAPDDLADARRWVDDA